MSAHNDHSTQEMTDTRSQSSIVCTVLSAFCAFLIVDAPAEEKTSVQIDSLGIVDQMTYADSINACGPAAIANSLKFGPAPFREKWEALGTREDPIRLRLLIDRYFKNVASSTLAGAKRWTHNGVVCPDLLAAYNQIVDRKIVGGYANRATNESDATFTKRIHRYLRDSLKKGVPPILSLRTYIARRDPDAPNGPVRWEPGPHHYIVVSGVPDRLNSARDVGFLIDLVDPNAARQGTAFIFPEKGANFRALRGETLPWHWLDDRPYLLVTAPSVVSLVPDHEMTTFADRVIVALNYVIGDFAP